MRQLRAETICRWVHGPRRMEVYTDKVEELREGDRGWLWSEELLLIDWERTPEGWVMPPHSLDVNRTPPDQRKKLLRRTRSAAKVSVSSLSSDQLAAEQVTADNWAGFVEAEHRRRQERLERNRARLQILAGARDPAMWKPDDVEAFVEWLPAELRPLFSDREWWPAEGRAG